MNVNVHIERLVLDGVDTSTCDGDEIGRAVELELQRLLATDAAPSEHGFSVQSAHGAPLTLSPGAGSEPIGAGIARSVYGQLSSPAPPTSGGELP